ncbi:RNA pseudouridylate synthases [Ceraceosorus bombacis]|uniref:RNA pseudouridylate synthases n=1 Tax=Ceraceosorus bombacis TaxID=401625 RepID=A0A0P1B740_9BASI|nr:RNA pseudouridylate synthases [Ceraceosorus bombacis]
MTSTSKAERVTAQTSNREPCGALRTCKPYWHAFETRAKQRWQGRSLVDIFVTEFRDRTLEYYVWAIRSGYVTINSNIVDPTYVLKDGDTMLNKIHRHEPAVSAEPIKILYHSPEHGRLVIVKPGSIPVHPAGRYAKHTLLSMLQEALGLDLIYTSNRLDRLTSGIMILSLTRPAAQQLSMDMTQGLVRKAYVARARGKFPTSDSEIVTCREPILGVDRQTGLNVVHPLGKSCETMFQRMSYDETSDTSVVLCRPITGRTHQIRVHLQWLGHAIPNDPIYAHEIWISDPDVHPCNLAKVTIGKDRNNLEPGMDGYNAETAGCPEIAKVVAALKTDKDDKEDWARWRDEVKFGKLCQQQGWHLPRVEGPNAQSAADPRRRDANGSQAELVNPADEGMSCEVCKVPLQPDPPLSSLYIYLHAIKYETDEWAFEDELPWWARQDWRSRAASDANPALASEDKSVWPTVVQAQDVKVSTSSNGKLHVYMHDSALPTLEQSRQNMDAQSQLSSTTTPASTTRPGSGEMDESARASAARSRRPLVDWQLCKSLPTEVELPSATPSVMFEVWGGLEDYAQRDIEAVLRHYQPDVGRNLSHSALHSGHLIVQAGKASQLALRLYISGALDSVKSASLLLHRCQLPAPLLAHLQADREAIGERKRNERKAAEAEKKQKRKEAQQREVEEAAKRRKERGIAPAAAPITQNVSETKNEAAEVVVERLATKLRHKPNTKQKPQAGKAQPATPGAGEIELNEQGQAPSELELLHFLDQGWKTTMQSAQEGGLIDSWTRVISAFGVDVSSETLRTFRATVERATYIFPTLTQLYLESQLGESVGLWLQDLEKERGSSSNPWHVSLRDPPPSLNLTLKFVRSLGTGQSAAEIAKHLTVTTPAGSVAWCLALPSARTTRPSEGEQSDRFTDLDASHVLPKSPAHRPPIPTDLMEGGTALARYRAYLMTVAFPIPFDRSPDEQLRILEPCVGSGGIAVELFAALRARAQRKVEVYACDVDQDEVTRASRMFRLCESSHDTSSAATIQLARVDSADPSALATFVGGRGTMDGIITDLPWGHRVSSHQQLSKLYPRLVQAFCHVLKAGGVALLMTAEHLMLRRATKALEAAVRKSGGGFVLKYIPLALDLESRAQEDVSLGHAELVQTGQDAASLNEGERVVDVGYKVYLCLLQKVWL